MLVAVLDHENLSKSRKALFATSISTIILKNAEMTDGPIKLSGFEIVIKQDTILFWLQLAVLYFLYIFLIRLFESFDQRRLERVEAFLEQKKVLIEASNEKNLLAKEMEDAASYKMHIVSRKFFYFAASEAAPAIMAAAVAIVWSGQSFLSQSIP
jgi:glucosamine 6-phosphate synthetase-like amidotransferase/phosphosugar isomerase protein